MSKKVALYARVSTDLQQGGMESQVRVLKAYFTRDRVKIGLANARAKGKLIGRKKMRDSDLIRKLLKAGMSYRNISTIAKCSHGSVSAERAAMKREEAELQKKQAEIAEAERELQKLGTVFPDLKAPEAESAL